VVVHTLLVEGSDLFFNRAEALLNIDFSKYSQATQALPGTLELPCGRVKEILGTLLEIGSEVRRTNRDTADNEYDGMMQQDRPRCKIDRCITPSFAGGDDDSATFSIRNERIVV
jgi:hypothetical protein